MKSVMRFYHESPKSVARQNTRKKSGSTVGGVEPFKGSTD
jgi:hypothetical protein